MKEWIESLVGSEWAEVTYFVIIALSVVIILLLVFMLYKFIRRPVYERGRRGKQARLAVTDAAAIDDRRRLVLLRRDDIEHLILIGGPTDIVIESDIRKNAPARPLSSPQGLPTSTQVQTPASNQAPTPPQPVVQKKPDPTPTLPPAHQTPQSAPAAINKPATLTERRESSLGEAKAPYPAQANAIGVTDAKPDPPKPEAVKPETQRAETAPAKPVVAPTSSSKLVGTTPEATTKPEAATKDDGSTKDAMDALLDEITQPRS